jgi:hypothetical protein
MNDELQKLKDRVVEQRNKIMTHENEIQHLKGQVNYYKTREDRLWQTLMAMSAVVRGSPMPPMPEVTKSYYGSFIEDAKRLYDYKTKPWWKRIWK